jgi:DNA repair protein RadC
MSKTNRFLVSEIKISYEPKIKPSDRIVVRDAKTAYKVFLANWDMKTIYLVEHFKIMCLNRASQVLGVYPLAIGGVSGVIADPKIIFLTAIGRASTSIILAHNHPSGNLEPSKADIAMSKKLAEGGKLLDIPVYDHLIITPDSFLSLAEEGEM